MFILSCISNVYDSYGESLLIKGDKKNALINFEKALKLNPESKTAQEQITKLKKEINN